MNSSDAIEHDRQSIVEVVAAEKQIVLVPDPADDGERHCERGEAYENAPEVGKVLRNFERHDQQRERETEDGVAEPLDAGYFSAAQHGR